jgi:hypothetical protein
MSYEQFYKGPTKLTVAYRKAHYERRDRANFDAYLQAFYIRDAMINIAPMFNALSKEKQIKPWLDKPYQLRETSDHDSKISNKEDEDGSAAGRAYMEAWIEAYRANKKMEEKENAQSDTE